MLALVNIVCIMKLVDGSGGRGLQWAHRPTATEIDGPTKSLIPEKWIIQIHSNLFDSPKSIS